MVTKPNPKELIGKATEAYDSLLAQGGRVSFGKFIPDGEDHAFVILSIGGERKNKWDRPVRDVTVWNPESQKIERISVSLSIAAQLDANRRARGKNTEWPQVVRVVCGMTVGESGGEYRAYSFQVVGR